MIYWCICAINCNNFSQQGNLRLDFNCAIGYVTSNSPKMDWYTVPSIFGKSVHNLNHGKKMKKVGENNIYTLFGSSLLVIYTQINKKMLKANSFVSLLFDRPCFKNSRNESVVRTYNFCIST